MPELYLRQQAEILLKHLNMEVVDPDFVEVHAQHMVQLARMMKERLVSEAQAEPCRRPGCDQSRKPAEKDRRA